MTLPDPQLPVPTEFIAHLMGPGAVDSAASTQLPLH